VNIAVNVIDFGVERKLFVLNAESILLQASDIRVLNNINTTKSSRPIF
jgi:hypothetical protein